MIPPREPQVGDRIYSPVYGKHGIIVRLRTGEFGYRVLFDAHGTFAFLKRDMFEDLGAHGELESAADRLRRHSDLIVPECEWIDDGTHIVCRAHVESDGDDACREYVRLIKCRANDLSKHIDLLDAKIEHSRKHTG